MLFARLRSLFRNLLYRDRMARELDQELRATVDVLVDEHLRAGGEDAQM